MDNNQRQMTAIFGIGMFFYGMGCVLIGAIIVYYVTNKFKDD